MPQAKQVRVAGFGRFECIDTKLRGNGEVAITIEFTSLSSCTMDEARIVEVFNEALRAFHRIVYQQVKHNKVYFVIETDDPDAKASQALARALVADFITAVKNLIAPKKEGAEQAARSAPANKPRTIKRSPRYRNTSAVLR